MNEIQRVDQAVQADGEQAEEDQRESSHADDEDDEMSEDDKSAEERRAQIELINDTLAQWIKPRMCSKYRAMKRKYKAL